MILVVKLYSRYISLFISVPWWIGLTWCVLGPVPLLLIIIISTSISKTININKLLILVPGLNYSHIVFRAFFMLINKIFYYHYCYCYCAVIGYA